MTENEVIADRNRVYLSSSEYYALRCLFGLVSELEVAGPRLKKRLHTIKGGWRDWRMLATVSEKLMQSLLDTVPSKKLLQIHRELKQTHVEIAVRPAGVQRDKDTLTYVPEQALRRLITKLVDWECLGCEKQGKDAKRCPLRQDLEACFHFNLPFKDRCPFSEFAFPDIEEDEHGIPVAVEPDGRD